jgi:cell division protein FtsB
MTSRLEASALSLLILYFAYHAFAGEQGLGSWSDSQLKLQDRNAELAMLDSDIARLRTDINRLTPGTVDHDFVEALARDKLAFVYPNEVVIIGGEPTLAN